MTSKIEYRIVPCYHYTRKGDKVICKLQKRTWLGWWDCEVGFCDFDAAKRYIDKLKEVNN